MKVVIVDLDNTLYDWVSFYVPSFKAMVEELHVITGISQEALLASFQRVHQRHRTTEYSFALQELDVLREADAALSPVEIYKKYDSAIHVFRRMRNRTLHPYRHVRSTLAQLRRAGFVVGAATESLHYHAVQRLKQLRIEQHLNFIASAPDHGEPPGLDKRDLRIFEQQRRHMRGYDSAIRWIPIPIGLRKPDSMFLLTVLEAIGIAPHDAAYVGDSLKRDVLMAQRADVLDVYASYGAAVEPGHFDDLLKITYWRDDDIEADRQLSSLTITPTHTIGAFSDVLRILKVHCERAAASLVEPRESMS